MPCRRHFTGYKQPFLHQLVKVLLSDRATLPSTLVIVPTAQSGRILREHLAASATAVLAPTVQTPGGLLQTDSPDIAPRWMEQLAWTEVLDSLTLADWTRLTAVLPQPLDNDGPHSPYSTLASEFTSLQRELSDHLLTLSSAAQLLEQTPDSLRWQQLASLLPKFEATLSSWSYRSRSAVLVKNFSLPTHFSKIIVAGVSEMPPCLVEALGEGRISVDILLCAEAEESAYFSPLGIPLDHWQTAAIDLPTEPILASDPAAQACLAVDFASSEKLASSDIAIGSPDEQTGAALAKAFRSAGWPAFHPAAPKLSHPLTRWLRAWSQWLQEPTPSALADLLSLPEVNSLVEDNRAELAAKLARAIDRSPTLPLPELLIAPRSEEQKPLAIAIQRLLSERKKFTTVAFDEGIIDHLAKLHLPSETYDASLSSVQAFLNLAKPLINRSKRSHLFWLSTLAAELPSLDPQPPHDRAIDIHGWLELLYQPGSTLILAGLNENHLPAAPPHSNWLSENSRTALGLHTDRSRHARDAYLLHALTSSRQRSILICGKSSAESDPLLPSRLLFQCSSTRLTARVHSLFKELEPSDANLSWQNNWQWQPPATVIPKRFHVTSLSRYLTCPFRFYLQDLAKFSSNNPQRREMDHGEYGSLIHHTLEIWGQNPDLRDESNPQIIYKDLDHILQKRLLEQFGRNLPIAISLQAESIASRLKWFAAAQAEIRSDGWEILHVERKIVIPFGDLCVSGKIDRIDQCSTTGQIRIIDYKTGEMKDTANSHLRKITANSAIPDHLRDKTGPFIFVDGKGKSHLWKNLQLPLYVQAEAIESAKLPIPAYFTIGDQESKVRLMQWQNFTPEILESARECAAWIVEAIRAQIFWPPTEKADNDAFVLLPGSQSFSEAFTNPIPSSSL